MEAYLAVPVKFLPCATKEVFEQEKMRERIMSQTHGCWSVRGDERQGNDGKRTTISFFHATHLEVNNVSTRPRVLVFLGQTEINYVTYVLWKEE